MSNLILSICSTIKKTMQIYYWLQNTFWWMLSLYRRCPKSSKSWVTWISRRIHDKLCSMWRRATLMGRHITVCPFLDWSPPLKTGHMKSATNISTFTHHLEGVHRSLIKLLLCFIFYFVQSKQKQKTKTLFCVRISFLKHGNFFKFLNLRLWQHFNWS